jgi:hypothetical protein
VILTAGLAIGGIATVALVFIFRGFGKQPGSSSHFGLMAGLLGFVFLICVVLFFLSYRGL